MNTSLYAEPQQLYSHCAHAGGWPKLGWQCADTDALGGDDLALANEYERLA